MYDDRSRRSQKWINEELYRIMDVFASLAIMYVEFGFRPADVRRTTERIKSPMGISKEWERTARQEEELADQAAQAGRRQSAAEFYYRAALYYGPAAMAVHSNSPRKLDLYRRLVRCYERFIEHFDEWPVRRVEIPFENGRSIPGILQTVPGVKAPCVLVVPGMDTIKEYMPSPYHNHFRRRGMASLSIDGPGQGESNIRQTWITLDNYERAGSAAIDFLETVADVDCTKIGIYGWSMGSYLGSRIAAHDRRVKASVGAMGTFGQKDTIFKHGKPVFRANFKYMSNTYDEDAFDAMAAQMSLEPLAKRFHCPTLMTMGEYDEICPLEDGERLFSMLECPKELWIYENETHSFGSRLPDFYLQMADWMRDALDGKTPAGHNRRVYHTMR